MRQARKKTPLRDLTTLSASRAVRLPNGNYAGNIDVHATICADRGTPFYDEAIAGMVCDNVEIYCKKLRFVLYGYCLMPNHLHVLLSPGESDRPLSQWLNSFKSYTTHEFMRLGAQSPLWQRSAHDHVCRSGETAERVLAYVVNNPVRAGLVERWADWPWTKVFMEI